MKRSFVCAHCGGSSAREAGAVNRALASGAPLYCGRACVGLARRLVNPPTEEERKKAKRQYDAKRRIEKHEELCAKKRAHYYANHERISATLAEYRKANMHRHVEYCRQPEYKAWKAEYDRKLRARPYGEFADAFLLLQDVEREVLARATRYEIMLTNGTLNKAQTRRRAL